MVTAASLARLCCLTALALAGCGRSNAERPFPAEGGAGPLPVADAGGGSGGTGAGGAGARGGATGGATGGTGGAGGGRSGDAAPTADSGAGGATGRDADADPPADGATAPPADSAPGACQPAPVPACDAPPPDPGARRPWRDFASNLAVVSPPRHRGRDQFVVPGARQWLIAKFAYGLFDDDIENEDVDIYLLRNCAGSWEKLATVRTTREGQHPTVEDVADSGGRVYHELTGAALLGPGRHRVHFVVGGDLSTTEAFIEVLPRGAPIFISDVDGTLTPNETAEFGGLLTGAIPDANPDSPRMLGLLAGKGVRPLYLTARPEWLTGRTREFLAKHGYPPGIVHTTLGGTGATGAPAAAFKSAELAALLGKGLRPVYAFGNTETDAEAYANGRVEPAGNRVFYRYADGRFGGRRIDAWNALEPELTALPPACPAP